MRMRGSGFGDTCELPLRTRPSGRRHYSAGLAAPRSRLLLRFVEVSELLFEPVVGVGFVVESRDLDVAAAAIQRLCLVQRLVGLQPERTQPHLDGLRLERIEDPARDAEAAGGR